MAQQSGYGSFVFVGQRIALFQHRSDLMEDEFNIGDFIIYRACKNSVLAPR